MIVLKMRGRRRRRRRGLLMVMGMVRVVGMVVMAAVRLLVMGMVTVMVRMVMWVVMVGMVGAGGSRVVGGTAPRATPHAQHVSGHHPGVGHQDGVLQRVTWSSYVAACPDAASARVVPHVDSPFDSAQVSQGKEIGVAIL